MTITHKQRQRDHYQALYNFSRTEEGQRLEKERQAVQQKKRIALAELAIIDSKANLAIAKASGNLINTREAELKSAENWLLDILTTPSWSL